VDLGTAGNYVILAAAGITNVPGSVITGDIGVSPIAATAITGFSLTLDSTTEFAKSTQVVGDHKVYAADYTSPTSVHLTTAVSDMQTAYTDSQGRTQPNAFYNNINEGEIGELELTKGVYIFSTSVTIGKSIKFSGSATDVFIIRTSNDLTQIAGTTMILEGVLAENIFWSVAGKVVVQAGAHMEGILLVKTSATFITGSSLNGRVLSQTAVALQKATI
ncbi:antifreeze protein, partial [Fragilariopsis cylindrus CCMP1102]